MEQVSTLAVSEENVPPFSEPSKKKFTGEKVKELSSVVTQVTESSFLRVTDTFNLNDVWFLPKSVSRTSSENYLSIELAVVINGTSLIMFDHWFKVPAEELMKMIYLCRKMRAAIEMTPFPYSDFQEWRTKEYQFFNVSPDVVRGDKSEAAFAEYEFTKENFHLRQYNPQCSMRAVFRKSYRHIYRDDSGKASIGIYGCLENPNMIECTAMRGTYSYCIEVRMMFIGDVGDESKGEGGGS